MKFRAYLSALAGILSLVGTQPTSAGGEITVGTTASLSGVYEQFGRRQLNGIQMWADDVNGRGALLGRRVKLVYYDDKSDPKTSAALYERLIVDDKVDLLLGPYGSELTLEAAAVADRHGFPMVATGASASTIWEQGYQNIFGVDIPAANYMNPVLDALKGKGTKRIAVINAETSFATEVTEAVTARAGAGDLQLVFQESYDRKSVDYDALVARVRKSEPDIVIGGTYLDDSLSLVRAAKKQNFAPKAFVFTVGPGLPAFGEQLGADAEGIIGVVQWMRSGRLPNARDFAFRYDHRFGENPGAQAAIGYGAGQVLEAAVRLAGSLDKDPIRDQLRTMKFRSLVGHYGVDATGMQKDKETYALQWQDGHRWLILPKNLAEKPVLYPLPAWETR